MRIDPEEDLTARDVVNRYGYTELARIIREYGEEGDSMRIARAIVEARKKRPITDARTLAEIVTMAKRGRGKIHPATKSLSGHKDRGKQRAVEPREGPSGRDRRYGEIGANRGHHLPFPGRPPGEAVLQE